MAGTNRQEEYKMTDDDQNQVDDQQDTEMQKAVDKLALDNALLMGQMQYKMMQESFNN